MKPVYYAQCSDYSACGDALKRILLPQIEERGGVTGKTVLLKPNLLAWRHENDIACVHPRVIVETARVFKEAGAAGIVLYENPAVQTAPSILHAMGIDEELKKLGVFAANFADYRKSEVPDNVRFHDLEIASEYLKYDFVCDIAKVKTHAMMTLTLCVKNLFGLVNGSARLGWHLAVGRDFEQFADMLLDLYLIVHPAFNVADGIVCMEGNGPGSGTPCNRNFLAGCSDSLVLDSSVAERLGVRDLLLLKNAAKRNLDTAYENRGEIPELEPLTLPDPPGIMMQWGLSLPPVLRDWMRKSMLSRPVLDASKCIGCGLCTRMCPPKSLKLVDGKPVFRLEECIRCFCCQEHCPKGAITPRKTWSMKMAEGMERTVRSLFRRKI